MNQTYAVQRGDTLYSIANKFGTTVTDIYNLNNLTGTNLYIGQILKIPSTSNTLNTITYTVKRGDTLYGISNQYGVAAIDIYNLNNLTSTNLSIGQILKIPSISGSNPAGLFTYTVKKGDSLYNIAQRYETTVDQIVKLNHLTSTTLSIGQKLSIPETGESTQQLPTFINYIVKKGDNLYSIARDYNITIDEIIKDNNLNSNNLSIGQNLKIRTNKSDEAIEECFGEEYTPKETYTNYTVVKGDSLYKIAQKFNTSVDNIKQKNNLTSNNLSIGQILKI